MTNNFYRLTFNYLWILFGVFAGPSSFPHLIASVQITESGHQINEPHFVDTFAVVIYLSSWPGTPYIFPRLAQDERDLGAIYSGNSPYIRLSGCVANETFTKHCLHSVRSYFLLLLRTHLAHSSLAVLRHSAGPQLVHAHPGYESGKWFSWRMDDFRGTHSLREFAN